MVSNAQQAFSLEPSIGLSIFNVLSQENPMMQWLLLSSHFPYKERHREVKYLAQGYTDGSASILTQVQWQ